MVGKLSPTIVFKVFDCQILLILEYGSDIWYTGDDVTDLEKIHLKFIKSTLGVRKLTPTPAIYGDTGRFPLIIRQHIKAVKYWCRILKLSQSHPVKNAYNMLLELDVIGFTNWCSRIRSVLERTGLHQTWESQNIGDTNKFLLSFKKSRGNHLITAMARYRMSSHDLNIERERFNNPITPKNQRICTRCELNEIDDEIHLLCHCSAMNNVREILFDSVTAIINIQPKNEMFLRIMTSRDITVVKSLAQFIYGCFKQIKG